MPVVVVGASGLVGRSLVPALTARSPEVRAVVRRRDAAEPLRALGAKVAVDDLSDPESLAAPFRDAHTLVHLAGGMDAPDIEDANLGTVQRTLAAAADAGLRRVLFLSYPGAGAAAANPYLRAKGRAEEAIRASGLQHEIVRATHVYGAGSRWLMQTAQAARRRIVLGSGDQRVAPVFVEDVAAMLAAADDRATETSGTFGLEGPDVVTADELADLLAGRRRRLHVRPGGPLAALVGRRVPAHVLEVLAADSRADAPDAATEFAVPRTSLAEGLRRSQG